MTEGIEMPLETNDTTQSQIPKMKTFRETEEKDFSNSISPVQEKSSNSETFPSPISVMISTSMIEEAYQSIISHGEQITDEFSEEKKTMKANKKKNEPVSAPDTSSSQIKVQNQEQVSTQSQDQDLPQEVEEADILVDAFETMADIATELFNPTTYSAMESTLVETVGAVTSSLPLTGVGQVGEEDGDDNANDQDDHNKTDTPFDEKRGLGTPVFSNRKNVSSTYGESARMRSKHSQMNQGGTFKKNHPHRQLKWGRKRISDHYRCENLDESVESNNSYVNDESISKEGSWNVLGVIEKQINDVFEGLGFGLPADALSSSDDDSEYDSDSDYSDESESTMEESGNFSDVGEGRGGNDRKRNNHLQQESNNKRRDADSQSSAHHSQRNEDGKERDLGDMERNKPAQSRSSALKDFLYDITSKGINVKWLKPVRTSYVRAPSCSIDVVVYIKINDSDSSQDNVEPNLVWEIDTEKKNKLDTGTSASRFQDVKTVRERVSLFDIASVQKAADSMNLHSFPHAIPEHSVLITLHNGNIYFFEAKDEVAAKLVIHGLRWISARLVFNLLTGNRNVCSEMLPMSMHNASCQVLSSEVMRSVTDHLVDKSLKRLSEHSFVRKG